MTAAEPTSLVLVLSDEVLAEITRYRLELLGYSVRVASTAAQALRMIRERLPAVLLVQLDLPGMSGAALIEQLATENDTSRIPVLAIAADAEMETVERTIAAGASDYLVVPFDPLVLERKVIDLLAAQAATDKTSRLAAARG
jgi:CheY-like chemotaxis protein